MKILCLAFLFSFAAAAQGLLTDTNFVRLDVDAAEVTVYVPDGHCTIQLVSNLDPLYDATVSSSGVGPALRDALAVNDGKIDFVKHRLAVDLTAAHHGGFGSIVRIRTTSGRSLRDVIQTIIPAEHGDESNLILTLIGNDRSERRCSFQ